MIALVIVNIVFGLAFAYLGIVGRGKEEFKGRFLAFVLAALFLLNALFLRNLL
ncbi:MAG: hypothetical protein M0R06_00920 [Sphaerochaeta sp.]|jgi:hypothetical protein|nr:hypothetical protein [Sphaerochaeta sp.]